MRIKERHRDKAQNRSPLAALKPSQKMRREREESRRLAERKNRQCKIQLLGQCGSGGSIPAKEAYIFSLAPESPGKRNRNIVHKGLQLK